MFGDDVGILEQRDLKLLLLVATLPPLGGGIVSPILDSLVDTFGTTPADIGLMIAFFTAPGILLIPISGILSDRYGRKPVLISSMILYGVAGIAITLTVDFGVVLGLRFLQGVGYSGITPVLTTFMGDIFTGEAEFTGQGFRNAVGGLSGAFFPVLSGSLVVFAWQYPFLLYAVSLPLAILVACCLDEPTKHERSTASSGLSASYLKPLAAAIRQPHVLAIVIARAMPTVIWVAFITYNSIVVVRLLDGTPPEAGLIKAVSSVFLALAASQTGRFGDWFEGRFWPVVGGHVCLTVGFGVMLLAENIVVAGLGVALLGVGFGVTISIYRGLVTGVGPDALRGSIVSLSEAGDRVVSTLIPVLMGGIIAVAAATMSFGIAVRLAGVVVALISGIGGIALIAIYAATAPDPGMDSS